ncbi:MAG: hypothetical protein E7575_02725 [Ruminococcaceae bacterium]|nr:hypothetical protein [Oscillospiraceae bacterium]
MDNKVKRSVNNNDIARGASAARAQEKSVVRQGASSAPYSRYTQMPLRPMTAMPPKARNGQQVGALSRPDMRPPAMGERRPMSGNGGRPLNNAGPNRNRSTNAKAAGNQANARMRPAVPRPGEMPGRAVPSQSSASVRRPAVPRPNIPQKSIQGSPSDPRQKLRRIEDRRDRSSVNAGSRPQSSVPASKRAAPKRPEPKKRDWVLPEGSAVYSAEGIMYEKKRRQAIEDARMKEYQRIRALERQKLKRKIFTVTKMFFARLAIFLLVFSLLIFWRYRSEFYSQTSQRKGDVAFSMQDSGSYTAKASSAYKDDILYVDFSSVSRWMNMVSVGSISCMRFICIEEISETSSGAGGEEYVIFTDGSSNAVVNGMSIILEGQCRVVNNHVWVPLSFVENYVEGLRVNKNAKGSSVTFEYENEAEGDGAAVSFRIKKPHIVSRVEYPS